MYTCSGIVYSNGTAASGVEVRVYLREDGTLVSGTITGATGRFIIETPTNQEHYVVALFSWADTNALVYDWITPEL